MIPYSSFLKLTKFKVVRKLPGEIDIHCGGTKAGRLDHQRKGNFRSICIRWCVFGGRAWYFDETKEAVARISRTAAHLGCSSESLEAGKAVESPEAKTALELLRLSARSFLQMRSRFARSMFRRLSPAGDGQKSRARDARV